ncbi:hypothetical protein EAI_14334 [Harpegnathos saltator]|uniref:Uncharacterized protein n=2 Tax=Harpegnathos saltator TaxID=610380 RepID=E2BRL4_HARSA|nr:hypothetical protein EAI_14334 [Harpegnathos saltator]
MYASVEDQMSNILGTMEDYLPKYLTPAISMLKRSFSEGILDVDEIYRPNWGPLKSDLLEKIPVKELQEAAVPLNYREPVKNLKGPWSKIVGETVSFINNKVIRLHRELIGHILANLRIPDATIKVRESVTHLIEYLQQNGEHEFLDVKTSFDPYKLVLNTISSLPLRNQTLVAANLLLPFLKTPAECRSIPELENLYHNNIFNYTMLMSRNRIVFKTGSALIPMIEQNVEVQDIVRQFSPFEYMDWKDLLLSFISHLRRHQGHRDKMSNIMDNVYGDLVLQNFQKRWQLVRNQVIAKTVFSAIGRKENSARIQRLLTDVSLNKSIQLKDWQKAIAFISDDSIGGPINATLKTLKALLISEILSTNILKANIAELVDTYDNKFNKELFKCSGPLENYLTNFTHIGMNINKNINIANVDVEDLFQALRDLDVYTDEYKSLQSFLSQDDLEAKIGKIVVNAYPTRGRLLSQLLHMLKYANSNDLRYLVKQFIDNVVYEGYGAGSPLLHFN